MAGSDLYFNRNTCSLTALALSPSLLFHSILFSVKKKKSSTWPPQKLQTLILCSGNTSLTLNCPKIQCRDYAKHNTETDTTVMRGHKTYTCANENPEPGIFQTGKRTNHMSRNIYDHFFVCVFMVENLGIQRKILII